MPENRSENSKKPVNPSLDLNALSSLSFGPDWAGERSQAGRKKSAHKPRSGSADRRDASTQSPRQDRRSGLRPSGAHHANGRADFKGRESRKPNRAAPVLAAVDVALYPQDDVFDALVKRLRTSARTYQLFEIAQLILEKSDRYVLVIANKKATGDSDLKPLYYSVPAHLPFATESEAVDFVLAHYMEQFFELEVVEVPAPSGNFQMINKCPVTGALIGPPNYHKYANFLKQHFEANVTGMSFEAYQNKVVADKEQATIDAWLEGMKAVTQYRVKDPQAGEPEVLDDLVAVRQFLMLNRKSSVVGSDQRVRFAGRDIEKLPQSALLNAVKDYVERQVQFPLDTANNIRGRLRRHRFTVYKKGAKGISYVCAVKRKFRDQATVLTDSIAQLVGFLEKHPNVAASKLPKLYLGIDTEKQQPRSLVVSDAEIEAAKQTESSQPVESQAVAGVDAVDASASTEAKSLVELSDEAQLKLSQLMRDLRWLITEGYVSEYGDGSLYIPLPQPEPKLKTSGAVDQCGEKSLESDQSAQQPRSTPTASDPERSSDATPVG